MKQIIGTCSNCGGPVEVPSPWYGVNPPAPTCRICGATPPGYGPVINMGPPHRSYQVTRTNTLKLGPFLTVSGYPT